MSASQEYLLDILRDLLDQSVRFIVCGGVAAVLHGVQRLTVDLDLSLTMTSDNLNRFLAVMKGHGMVPRAPIPAESILDPELMRRIVEQKGAVVFTFVDPNNASKQVDFFLTEDKSYESLLEQTVEIDFDGNISLLVLTIAKLIEMKRAIVPPRAKDLQDIEELQRIQESRS